MPGDNVHAVRVEPRPEAIAEAPSNIAVELRDPSGKIVFQGFASLRKFNTGSWGYHAAGKADCPRADSQRLQVNVQLTVIGSKEWDKPDQG